MYEVDNYRPSTRRLPNEKHRVLNAYAHFFAKID